MEQAKAITGSITHSQNALLLLLSENDVSTFSFVHKLNGWAFECVCVGLLLAI